MNKPNCKTSSVRCSANNATPFPLPSERDFRFCMSCRCIISSDFYSFSSGMYT